MKPEYKIISDLIEKNANVLDVGCDDGIFNGIFKRQIKMLISEELKFQKKKCKFVLLKGLTVIEGNAEFDLKQFPNDSFDYVVLGQTLQAL